MKDESTYLKIIAYKDDNFNNKIGEYRFKVNPSSYSHKHSINFSSSSQVAESAGNVVNYNTIDSETISFDVLFDGTAIFKGFKKTESVYKQIRKFKKVTYDFNGQIHRTNFLKISWGSLVFYGYLTNLDINYSLFKGNGEPLRANASVSFSGYVNKELLAQKSNKQSPDVTHIKTVNTVDNLPLLCEEVYNDSELYMSVAYANDLDTFRDLKVGSKINLPALKK